ncbi:hypothetical protein M3Y96_00979900 [Aphelenchoides besseyi]|nr:hypothetical protein M3Y96_00979900 [Aphelenchoides besseyi]
MTNPQLNPHARSLLFQHFEQNVEISSVRRFGVHFGKHESTPSNHVLRLIIVSSRFCITAHCLLEASTLFINSFFCARLPNHWTFGALNGRSYAPETGRAIVSLVKPRFGHLKVSKTDGQQVQIDKQFIRKHFVGMFLAHKMKILVVSGIPKLTIYGNAVDPLFCQMLVLMTVGLEALECNCNYLKPSIHMLPLNLKVFKAIKDFEVPDYFAEEALSCVETLAEHGEQVLKTNPNIEKLIYDVVIVFSGIPKTIEVGELAALQQSHLFTSGICSVLSSDQLEKEVDAKECPCNEEANNTILVLLKGKMKFFIYVFSSYLFSSADELSSDYEEVDSQS